MTGRLTADQVRDIRRRWRHLFNRDRLCTDLRRLIESHEVIQDAALTTIRADGGSQVQSAIPGHGQARHNANSGASEVQNRVNPAAVSRMLSSDFSDLSPDEQADVAAQLEMRLCKRGCGQPVHKGFCPGMGRPRKTESPPSPAKD